jgi:hypothetical protein
MKHLMGYKSEDTLGLVKGGARIDENKKFNVVLDKTKKLLNEMTGGYVDYEMLAYEMYDRLGQPFNLPSDEELFPVAGKVSTETGGSNFVDSETVDKLMTYFKNNFEEMVENTPQHREELGFDDFDEYPGDDVYGNDPDFMAGKSGGIRETKKILPKKINEMTGGYGFSNEGNLEGHENPIQEEDLQSGEQTNTTNQSNAKTDTNVDNLMNYIKEMPKFNTLASKIRTPDSKRNAGLAYAQLVAGGDKNILAKIGRAIMKASGESDGITNEGEIYELENPELADLNKDGEISSYEEKRGEAIEKSMKKDRFDEIFDGMYEEDSEEFIPHGHYTVSNTGGYEVMISDSGDAAKVRDAYGSDNPETSDWLEIEYVPGEDGEMEPVIDPNGYNIPLNMVMRTNR